MKPTIIVEFFTEPKGRKIEGILAIPRISRKGNLYLPEELKKGDGVTVPILWDHPEEGRPNMQILESDVLGYATLKWDEAMQQLKYEGMLLSDPPAGNIKVSLGAIPSKTPDHFCGSSRCYEVPRGLQFIEMSMTRNPGMPETTLTVTESFAMKQCGCAKTEDTYPWDQCMSDAMDEYGDEETAKQVCGAIKAKYGESLTEGLDMKAARTEAYKTLKMKTEAGDEELQACVAAKIKAHGGEPTDQELAIKYSECRKELGMSESVKTESKKKYVINVNLV